MGGIGAWRDGGVRTLLSGALLVTLAGFFSNVANLIVSVFIAHLLHHSQYGEYSQLVGLYFVISLPGSAIAVAVIRRGSLLVANHEADRFDAWRSAVRRQSQCVAISVVPLWALASWAVRVVLGGPSWLSVFFVGLGSFAWVFLSLERALLQVQRRYQPLALNFVTEGLVRSIAVLLLASVGVPALALAILLAELVTWWQVRRSVGPASVAPWGESTGVGIRLGVPLLTLSFLAILQFADVFLVGRMHHAGSDSYASVAQVSKMLVYLALIVTSFLLPESALASREGANGLRPLGLGIGLLALPAAPLLLLTVLMPHRLLALVFPSRDLHDYQALPWLVAAMWLLGIMVLGCSYLLAVGARSHVLGLIALTLSTVAFVGAAHGTAMATAQRYCGCLALGALGVFGFVGWFTRRRQGLARG